MFFVNRNTAERLFAAQEEEMRGQLRLDISSRCFPTDPTKPIDLCCAEEAIGERFLRLLANYAIEVAFFGGRDDEFPPKPDATDKLPIMPSKDDFAPFLQRRLQDAFGLNSENPNCSKAIRLLARDFGTWVENLSGEEREDLGVEVEEGENTWRASLRCEKPQGEVFDALEPLDPVEPEPVEIRTVPENIRVVRPSKPSKMTRPNTKQA